MDALAEAATYLVALALFSFVVQATARLRHEMLLLICIPPVFVAAIMGFSMGIYAGQRFGVAPLAAALLLPWPLARRLARSWSTRDLLLAIYLAWAIALGASLVAFTFPDAS